MPTSRSPARTHAAAALILASATLAATTGTTADAAGAKPQDARPNVLFIGIDDLRCSIGAMGDPVAHTPNIDRLAARGTLFRRAYVQQAVCSASRASLLTGTRPDTTTVDYPYNPFFFDEFLPAHPSLPVHFARSGYRTRSAGKIHHEGRELLPYTFEKSWWPGSSPRDYADPARKAADSDRSRKTWPQPWEAGDVPDETYRDGRIAASVADALSRPEADGLPFFYAAGFYKPHLPFNAPARYWSHYDRSALPLSPGRLDPATGAPAAVRVSYELPQYEGGQIDFADEARLRLLTHAYYACVSFTDAQVGRVIDALDASGQASRTIIVLWSDHGFHLGDNASFGKHTCHEAASRVPLIVVAPGMPAGQVSDALVEYVDIFPTVCDLAGVAAPAYLEGTSLVPVLRDPAARVRDAAFSQWPTGRSSEAFSIRTDRYRLTVNRSLSDGRILSRELYDHASDPGETVDASAREPALVAALEEHLAGRFGWR